MQARILLVESYPPTMRLLTVLLEEEGYHVTAVDSIEQACYLLAGEPFDLVLTDGFTDQRDQVFATTTPLRQAARATPIILCTTHRLTPDEVLQAGFCAFVEKPFHLDTFVAQVQAALATPQR